MVSRSQKVFLAGASILLITIMVMGCTPTKQGGFTCALVPAINKLRSYLPSAHKEAPAPTDEPVATRPSDPAPAINSFSASPTGITAGEKVTLEWDVTGAISVIIDQGVGSVGRTGVKAVYPKKDTVYTMTASNASGKTNSTVSVTVTEVETPPTPDPTQLPSTPRTPSAPSTGLSTPLPVSPPGDQGGSGPSSPFPIESSAPSGTPPVISAFSASPASITAGSCTTLSWLVSGATSVNVAPGGAAPSSGSAHICPGSTTTYVLTASNSWGAVNRPFTVTVTSAPPPPASPPTVHSFTATPASISAGNCSTLNWSTSGATSLSISPGVGAKPVNGSVSVCPASTTTFTLTATNAAGSTPATRIVTVTSAPPPPATPPTVNLTASPNTIAAGSCSTLSWSTTGATSVTVTPGGGSQPVNGSASVCPASTTTYTCTATNSAGSATDTEVVTVTAGPPPTPPPPADAATCEQALFDAVNARRTSEGRAVLARNAYIDGLCRTHAQYMATANALSHDNFSSRCSGIYSHIAGIHACAENVLQNNTPCNATAMATQWFNSPGHHDNMLNAAYTVSGMGIVIDGTGKIWACQMFAGP